MARYIDADMLDDIVQDFNANHEIYITRYEYKRIEAFLFCFPTADVVEQKKGEWIGIDDYPHEDWECSVCGTVFCGNDMFREEAHFCPHCGADMRGEEE